jgi:hypothetical protein
VNKSNIGSEELYRNLEGTNVKIYAQHEDGANLKKMQLKKMQSERHGDIKEADKHKIPRYFLFNQVVGDVKLFIEQMKLAVIEFYTIVAKQQDLLDIEEELYECLTDLILTGNLQKIVFAFFRLESEDRRDILKEKYIEYMDIQPQHVGVDEKFALNDTSPIVDIYEYMMQMGQRINQSFEGPSHYHSFNATSDDEDDFVNDYEIKINMEGGESSGSGKSRRLLSGKLDSKSIGKNPNENTFDPQKVTKIKIIHLIGKNKHEC